MSNKGLMTMMTIESLQTSNNIDIDDAIINLWLLYLETSDPNNIAPITIDVAMAERYRFNFYGLLLELGIPAEYHYPHLVVNGYRSSEEYRGDKLQIDIINSDYVAYLYGIIRDEKESMRLA